jgi:hypothetical protein
MRNRFIGDNGLTLHLLLQQARFTKFTGIGLLLDQEKAYDRVNPIYLIKVLAAFGFDDKFIRCIQQLFFGNLVQINVNGFFSPTVHQQRGLRQGDPLSPLLFNLALEPLLLAINQDTRITGYRFVQAGVDHYVKTLAYADDICTILHNQDDYYRLLYHLELYSSVSNAKFNQQKTEAFSLSGKPDRDWKELLQSHHITVYHTHNSSEPFRYLGYYMYYTIKQRNYLQDQMIAQVKEQVQLYSSRQLSIRGRATVINTLIMSKIWYRLRLIEPTQAFFTKLKSVIYGFVSLHKKPPLSFNQMCLPINQGGLGIIHPQKQHLSLQIRHLHHLFSKTNRSTLVQPLLIHQLSTITNSTSAPWLSFYVPEFRKHDLVHPTSILNAVYKAFDHFHIQPDFSHMSLQNILLLPLHYLFQNVPNSHWITRHRHFPASHFFIYDTVRQCLRLRVQGEYITKPRLCQNLQDQVVKFKTIKMQDYLWPFIQNEITTEEYTRQDDSLIEQLQTVSLWKHYKSSAFRNSNDEELRNAALPLSKRALKLFWSAPMLLQARGVWYRVLSHKIPNGIALKRIHITETTQCRLCLDHEDSFEHFLVFCSYKQPVWIAVMRCFYAAEDFQLEDIYQMLISLETPSNLRSAQYLAFNTVVSTTLWYIWFFYWQFIFHGQPFQTDTVLDKIMSQISILQNSSNLD